MITRKKTVVAKTKFSRELQIEVNGFTISSGDIIKIHGEHGRKFKFHSFVTNTETGAQWVDCFEVHAGSVFGGFYSYKIDRVKRIPVKRGRNRKKIVNK